MKVRVILWAWAFLMVLFIGVAVPLIVENERLIADAFEALR